MAVEYAFTNSSACRYSEHFLLHCWCQAPYPPKLPWLVCLRHSANMPIKATHFHVCGREFGVAGRGGGRREGGKGVNEGEGVYVWEEEVGGGVRRRCGWVGLGVGGSVGLGV